MHELTVLYLPLYLHTGHPPFFTLKSHRRRLDLAPEFKGVHLYISVIRTLGSDGL